jgi:hypothetical protein
MTGKPQKRTVLREKICLDQDVTAAAYSASPRPRRCVLLTYASGYASAGARALGAIIV